MEATMQHPGELNSFGNPTDTLNVHADTHIFGNKRKRLKVIVETSEHVKKS